MMGSITKSSKLRSKGYVPVSATLLNSVASQSAQNTTDIQNLQATSRHANVAPGGLTVYDPLRSIVTTASTSWRWFKMADCRITSPFRGFSVNFEMVSRYVQTQGFFRLLATTDTATIQFLRAKVGVGGTQMVLMREDANPTNYHILVKVGSFNSHVMFHQEVFATRLDDPSLVWNVDYQEVTAVADSTQTQVVTDYTGFTQIGSFGI